MQLSSPLAAPYALIRSGRPRPNRRPPTLLAYLLRPVTSRGEVRAWRGVELRHDGSPATDIPRRIESRDVVATFYMRPTCGAIARARRELPRFKGEK